MRFAQNTRSAYASLESSLIVQHSALLCGRFSLHLLGHLDVHLEELGDTAVQTDGLALVEFALAVGIGDALLGACVHEPVRQRVSDEISRTASISGHTG